MLDNRKNKSIRIDSAQEFEALYKKYYGPLVNFINQYLSNVENSKEVVQITFLKLWDKKDSLEITSSFKNYLYRSAKNTMIDYIRKYQKMKIVSDDENKIINNLPEKDDAYLSPFIIRSEIIKAMEALKPKNREIFRLSKFEGLTYEEIAAHLNISKRAVEDNVSRAIIRLREIISADPNIFD